MATVTGYTAARMKQIEDAAIIDGEVVGNNLILEPKGFATDPSTYPKIDAGNVRGPQGDQGPVGEVTEAELAAGLAATRVPAGSITMFAGAAAPATWALCDGGESNRTADAALFAVIGTTYGVGNGTTTFNRPNLQNRFPAGKGPVAWSDTLNDRGGSKDAVVIQHDHSTPNHQHSTPAHQHTIASHQHAINHNHSAGTSEEYATHHHGGIIGVDGRHAHAATATGEPLWYFGGSGTLGMDTSGTGHSGAPSNLYPAWTATSEGGDHTHDLEVYGGNAIHTHSVTVATHNGNSTGSGTQATVSGEGGGTTPSTQGGSTTGQAGVLGADLNLPPFITLNFIIKL